MTVPEASVAVELERLRGTIETRFAQAQGSLNVLVVQSDRNAADLETLKQETRRELDELSTEVEALKKNRWPLASVTALTAVVGMVAGVLALFLQ